MADSNRNVSAQQLNTARGTNVTRNNRTTTTTTQTIASNQKSSIEWRSFFTPQKLKLFHTIVIILFLILVMSYIFNTKSNVLRVLIILVLSAFMICESFIIYSYNWM